MEWGWDRLKETGHAIGSAASTMDGAWEAHGATTPVVRRIGLADLREALAEGTRDFGACRTDVVFLCMIYPIAGLIISRFAFDYGMLPLIFPLISGFALIAPLFGVGLYEMSRRRELGIATGWADAFAVIHSAAIGSIPPEYYEAAEVEGASALQKLIHITFPLLKPTTLYLTVIYTIAGFQIFERVYVMTRGGPINSTMTIVQLVFQTAFNDFNFGRASAEALILFAIIASFSFIQFKFLSTDVEY